MNGHIVWPLIGCVFFCCLHRVTVVFKSRLFRALRDSAWQDGWLSDGELTDNHSSVELSKRFTDVLTLDSMIKAYEIVPLCHYCVCWLQWIGQRHCKTRRETFAFGESVSYIRGFTVPSRNGRTCMPVFHGQYHTTSLAMQESQGISSPSIDQVVISYPVIVARLSNPVDTRRNNNVILTSKRRRFDVKMTLLLRRVPVGKSLATLTLGSSKINLHCWRFHGSGVIAAPQIIGLISFCTGMHHEYFFEVVNVLSWSPFMFENTENKQLDWRIRHSHLASTLFHSLVPWWCPRRIRPQITRLSQLENSAMGTWPIYKNLIIPDWFEKCCDIKFWYRC